MFSSASKRADAAASGLDQPLLASADDMDDRPSMATATHVGVVGIATGPGYQRVAPADDEDRDEASAARANLIAMRRQQEHQANFEKQMLTEEQRVVQEAKQRAAVEEEDLRLARELQSRFDSEAGPRAALPPTTMMSVTVPAGVRGGMPLAVDLPGRGRISLLVPHGLNPGDSFHFKVPAPAAASQPQLEVRVRVPQGLGAGATFPVQLPSGRVVTVSVPPGSRAGDELRVPYDQNSGVVPSQARPAAGQPLPLQQQQQSAAASAHMEQSLEDEALAIMESIMENRETAAERAEREAFLAALPEDVRREVLAQETAQKKHLSQFSNPPPPPAAAAAAPRFTADQVALLDTLPPDLRTEVERDMLQANAAKAASGPPAALGKPAAKAAPRPATEDLLDMSWPSQAAPSAPSLYPAMPPPAADDSVNMFQNLSVRGVAPANKDKSAKSQQI